MSQRNIQVRLNENMDTLAARARRARKYAELTQVQASEVSGVKQSDISKIERGETLRSVGLLALARAYGVNPDWLDTGCGEMLLSGAPAVAVSTPALREPTLEQTLDVLANALETLPEAARLEAAPLLQALTLAPDSKKLRSSLLAVLMKRG